MCPDTRIRGISLGWVDGNSFTLQKTTAKTTSMPVGGDHSVLQNIKLFPCKSMETMSQGPKAVTLSQRRPISVWRWWPAMSRRITPPLAEGEISQEGSIQLQTHPQEFGTPALFPSHANLSQAPTKDVFFPIEKWEGLMTGWSRGRLRELFSRPTLPSGHMWEWEGGVPQGSLTDRTWIEKGSNKQKLEGRGIQRKNWSSFSRLYWGPMSYLSYLAGGVKGIHDLQWEITRWWVGRSQTLWATFPLRPMSLMARHWFCMNDEKWGQVHFWCGRRQ